MSFKKANPLDEHKHNPVNQHLSISSSINDKTKLPLDLLMFLQFSIGTSSLPTGTGHSQFGMSSDLLKKKCLESSNDLRRQ